MKSNESIGIYIHIPFCIKKCSYCDFCSYDNALNLRSPYIKALALELSSYKSILSGRTVDTIYIGGGTPSLLEPHHILTLGEAIHENISLSDDLEFTFEVNPQSGIKSVLTAAKDIGVNRISMGLQSSDNEQLKLLGRSHDVNQFEKSFITMREMGFKNISIDIMTGLPGQSLNSLKKTIDYAVSTAPEHISAYALKIEEGTLFYKTQEMLDLPDEDLQSEMYIELVSRLEAYGYRQYEISNFAKSGFHSRHNVRYWTGKEYLGAGVSAHSYIGKERFFNTSSLSGYIEKMSSGITPVLNREILSCTDILEEYIMLRLRLKKGLDYNDFYNKFKYSFPEKFKNRYTPFVDTGFMEDNGRNLCFTPKGFLVSNYIISDLLLEL